MRVVSLFLPDWPIDRLRRAQDAAHRVDATGSEAPLIQAQRVGNQRLIYALNETARATGLKPGMAVAQAQALVPELAIQDAALAEDAAALEKLALWPLRLYAPLVAVDAPDGLVIDATGTAHLHGGEDGMLRDIVDRLADADVRARASVADSWGAAHAFARSSSKPVMVVAPGESGTLLQRLPLGFLRLPRDMVAQLRRLGFERVADIAS